MPRPLHHVFVCTLQRPPGHPRGCCSEKGGGEVLQLFWEELQKRGLHDKINFTASGCLGPCDSGVNVLVYPENVMYCNVTKDDVLEIFDSHLINEIPVTRLQAPAEIW